jgi:hypothetical protein
MSSPISLPKIYSFVQAQTLESFQPGQLRTLQGRVRQWRTEIARQLVLGSGIEDTGQSNAPSEEQEEEIISS